MAEFIRKDLDLFLVKRTDIVGYDEHDAFVVAAADKTEARRYIMDTYQTGSDWPTWTDNENAVQVTRIGEHDGDGLGTPEIILSSFKAG